MEQIALIMNNTLSRLAADMLLCCNGNNDNKKTLLFKVGFHHPANCYGASKYESYGYF